MASEPYCAEEPSRSTSTRWIAADGNQAVVDRLRTLVDRAERLDLQVDQRRAVAALAVDQHQRLVGRQVAQVGRAHEGGAVGDREALGVERRRDVGQLVGEVGRGLLLEVGRTEHVDRRQRFGRRAALHAGTGDDQLVEFDGVLAAGFGRRRPACAAWRWRGSWARTGSAVERSAAATARVRRLRVAAGIGGFLPQGGRTPPVEPDPEL